MTLRSQLQTAVSVLYPSRCSGCGGFVQEDFALCAACWAETEFINGVICNACGCPLPGAEAGKLGEDHMLCDGCLTSSPPWTRGRAAMVYGGRGRKLILGLKHGDRSDLARIMSLWMYRSAKGLLDDDALLVPVPLHWSRFLRRKYNQAALLAQGIAQHAGRECCPDALVRVNKTEMLDGKSHNERMNILDAAISSCPKRGFVLSGRRVVLVDDVMTSGATLTACTQACYSAGARNVDVAVLARVTHHITQL